jgi:hypothetical protein
LSFKNFLSEEISLKAPKPYKEQIVVNLKEYKEIISNSVLNNKKKLISRLEASGDFPVYCEHSKKFFMVMQCGKKLKTREIKSRDDKELTGVLLNGMLINEEENGSWNKVMELKSLRTNWEVPEIVYMKKDEYGKMVKI